MYAWPMTMVIITKESSSRIEPEMPFLHHMGQTSFIFQFENVFLIYVKPIHTRQNASHYKLILNDN